MDREVVNPARAPSDCERDITDELERRGFRVVVSQQFNGRTPARFYCRIRSEALDLTFFGETKEIALTKAIESLRPSAEAT